MPTSSNLNEKAKMRIAMSMLLNLFNQKEICNISLANEIITLMKKLLKKGESSES